MLHVLFVDLVRHVPEGPLPDFAHTSGAKLSLNCGAPAPLDATMRRSQRAPGIIEDATAGSSKSSGRKAGARGASRSSSGPADQFQGTVLAARGAAEW